MNATVTATTEDTLRKLCEFLALAASEVADLDMYQTYGDLPDMEKVSWMKSNMRIIRDRLAEAGFTG